ncbi:MAG: hypothetical protein P1V81_12485 [Planctomycetota bacterium]|nr:hypothetical protein [Planctomycetota bacterium]
MKHAAEQLAASLARLLDLFDRSSTTAEQLEACRAKSAAADEELQRQLSEGADPSLAREQLRRCERLRSLLMQRTESELVTIDGQLEKVRRSLKNLPTLTGDVPGGSFNLRA